MASIRHFLKRIDGAVMLGAREMMKPRWRALLGLATFLGLVLGAPYFQGGSGARVSHAGIEESFEPPPKSVVRVTSRDRYVFAGEQVRDLIGSGEIQVAQLDQPQNRHLKLASGQVFRRQSVRSKAFDSAQEVAIVQDCCDQDRTLPRNGNMAGLPY